VSLALVVAFLTWLLTRDRDSTIAKSLHEAVLPVLVGISLFWIVALLVKWGEPDSGLFSTSRLFEAEQTLLKTRLAVHAFAGPNLTTLLLVVSALLVMLFFSPRSRAIGRLIRAKKQLTRLHLCLLAMTSFTFFGSEAADKRAQAEHENRLRDFEFHLRTELDPAKNFLAAKLADEAVTEALKRPIPEPTRSRLVYLIQSFEQPVYTTAQVQDSPSAPTKMSPRDQIRWDFNHPSAARSVRVPLDSSSVMKTFIDDLSKDALSQVILSEAAASRGSAVESVARQQFGPVAESPQDWQRQEELIKDAESRAEQSEQLYKEASTGITEAVMNTFSEALGMLVPHSNELTNEWIKELIGEAFVPSFEHEIEDHAEAVLTWSRDNLAAGHIRDVPTQLRQQIRLAPTIISQILFPSFLAKGSSSSSSLLDSAKIPEEVTSEIRTRQERAASEINQERESRIREEAMPATREWEREMQIRKEQQERLREREFRERPRLP
jgi:hypothetical protein